VVRQCGSQVLTCLQDTACRTTLQCVTQKCLTGGAPSPTCVLGCGGSPQTLLELFSIFQCITGGCGPSCIGLLGGGGAPPDAGRLPVPLTPAAGCSAIVNEAFSAWPELCSRDEE
jgi:hypothetical protein